MANKYQRIKTLISTAVEIAKVSAPPIAISIVLGTTILVVYNLCTDNPPF
jgi:hypothetical protein